MKEESKRECAEPGAPIRVCTVCGKSVRTCERKVAVNNSYLCPVHGDGLEKSRGIWVCGDECSDQYDKDQKVSWFSDIKFFHPFNFLFVMKPKMEDPNWHPSDDLHQYGFSLDLTTELYYYTYDWGSGVNFRILGFGFEWIKVGK